MPDWLRGILPDFLLVLGERLFSPRLLLVLGILSAVTFVASVVGVPFFLTRLPGDYFSGRERAVLGLPPRRRPPWRIALVVLRNLLGFTLMVLGLLMLVLPGQGLLTLVVGLLLADFPGKRRLERWFIGRPSVLRAINSLRRRTGRVPLTARESWLPPKPPE